MAYLRVFSLQDFRTVDGQFVPLGNLSQRQSAYVELTLTVNGDKSLSIPSTNNIPFTTNSPDVPTAQFSAYLYDYKNKRVGIWLEDFTVPASLGSPFTWSDLERAQGRTVTPPPFTLLDRDAVIALIDARVSGAGAPKMTDVINGIGTLYEPAANSAIPKVLGLNSAFINSTRTSLAASLTGHVEGLTAKLTNGNQGQVYDNGVTYSQSNLGVYSITDFDANDNNSTDCTQKIQDAFDAIDVAGGGTVRFIASAKGQGKFVITDKLVWPSTGKLILEGDGSAIGGRVQLVLTGNNKSAIQVGQNLVDVTIRNLSFKTSGTGNKAILFTGSGSNATQIITVRDCTFDGFAQPIAVLATDIPKAWQCSYGLIENCTFHNFSDKGFYIDALNSDWDIRNCKFFGAVNAYGIYAAGCASLHIGACDFLGPAGAGPVCTLGVPNPLFSDTAIYLNGARGVITIDHKCQLENFRRTMVVNYADQTYPIEFNGNLMPAPIELNDDCVLNYSGNLLHTNTIQIPNGVDVRLCATGINYVMATDTCLDAATGTGVVLGTGSYIPFRPTVNGTEFGMQAVFGSFPPDGLNPLLASTPATRFDDSGIADKIYQAIDQIVTSVRTLRYKLTRNSTTGYLKWAGTQASPNRGYEFDAPLELGVDASATQPAGATGRLNWTGTLLQWLTSTTIYNVILASTTLTANRLQKATANGKIANALLSDDGTNTLLTSGLFRFILATSAAPALKRSGTTLQVRLADDSADAPISASTGTFSGAVTTPSLTTPTFTPTQGTITTNTPYVNHTATWNDGSVTFTGFKSNITDTASAAASLLMDLQVGGAAKFSVTKGGVVRLAASAVPAAPVSGDLFNDTTQKALQAYESGIKQSLSGIIFTSTASATVANSTTETSIIGTGVGTKTLPANFFVAGKTIRVLVRGIISATGTPTVNIIAKLGSTTIVSTTAIALAGTISNNLFEASVLLTCRTTGATGTVMGAGGFTYQKSTHAPTTLDMSATAAAVIDTTASQILDVTIAWGAADALNTISGQVCVIEVLN